MNYILIKTEYVNGFPNHSFESFTSRDNANANFIELVSKASSEYPNGDMNHFDSRVNYLESFSISDDRPTGNGYFYAIITEDEMVNAIINEVENSEETYLLCNRGNIPYDMSCKMIKIDGRETFYPGSDENYTEDIKSFMVDKVVKRPYDLDCPMDEDGIYDVYLTVHVNDFVFAYTDSLEIIGITAVFAVFCEIFIK